MAPADKQTSTTIMDLVGDSRHYFNKPVCLIASGPSLDESDVRRIEAKRINIISVNDSYRLAPDAGILFAADAGWWQAHKGLTQYRGRPRLICEGKGARQAAAIKYGLRQVPFRDGIGLSFNVKHIHTGMCSGFMALNLAVLMGCSPIYLLGYDCRPSEGKMHWFGDHPAPLSNKLPFQHMIRSFEAAEKQLRRRKYPSRVINLSRQSALTCFPRSTVDLIF